MRYFKVRIGLFLLVSLLGVYLIGCTGPIPKMEDIKGKWLAVERVPGIPGRSGQVGFMIEFFSDNTVMLPSGKRNWTILEDGRLQIDIPGMTMLGSLEGDILTITMPDEQGKVIFKKQ